MKWPQVQKTENRSSCDRLSTLSSGVSESGDSSYSLRPNLRRQFAQFTNDGLLSGCSRAISPTVMVGKFENLPISRFFPIFSPGLPHSAILRDFAGPTYIWVWPSAPRFQPITTPCCGCRRNDPDTVLKRGCPRFRVKKEGKPGPGGIGSVCGDRHFFNARAVGRFYFSCRTYTNLISYKHA